MSFSCKKMCPSWYKDYIMMNTDFSKLIVHLICISTKKIPSELEVVLHYKFTQVTLLAKIYKHLEGSCTNDALWASIVVCSCILIICAILQECCRYLVRVWCPIAPRHLCNDSLHDMHGSHSCALAIPENCNRHVGVGDPFWKFIFSLNWV